MSDVTIRPATVEDAASFNAHRRRIADEPDNGISWSPGEYTRPVAEVRERIRSIIATDNQYLLVAEADGEIVGQCSCFGSPKQALQHNAGLGIDVDKRYRGQGVGTSLMAAMLDWARANPIIQRIELEVHTHNLAAIHLYLKHGFEIEGRKQHAYFKDGRYVDAYLMAQVFDD